MSGKRLVCLNKQTNKNWVSPNLDVSIGTLTTDLMDTSRKLIGHQWTQCRIFRRSMQRMCGNRAGVPKTIRTKIKCATCCNNSTSPCRFGGAIEQQQRTMRDGLVTLHMSFFSVSVCSCLSSFSAFCLNLSVDVMFWNN